MINLQMKVMLQLMNLSPPKFLKNAANIFPLFPRSICSIVLYGVDAPVRIYAERDIAIAVLSV